MAENTILSHYARFVARYPWVIPPVILVLLSICAAVTLVLKPIPNFEKPVEGFVTRKTKISDAYRVSRLLTRKALDKMNNDYSYIPNEESASSTTTKKPISTTGGTISPDGTTKAPKLEEKSLQECALMDINESSELFVIEAEDSQEDLFTAKNLKAICQLEEKYIYPTISRWYNNCSSFSIPLYVTVINDLYNCQHIRDTHMENTKRILDKCATFYFNGSLDCAGTCAKAGNATSPIPSECTDYNAVYKILYYLADVGFYKNTTEPKSGKLTSTLLLPGRLMSENYIKYFHRKQISYKGVKLSAIYSLSLANSLFSRYMKEDMSFFVLAGVLVLFILFVYLSSFVLLIATILNVIGSFCLAYFIYFYIFQVKFFPFMNVLAILLLIAVGADDIFIFHDSWHQTKQSEKDLAVERIIYKTFSHAALSTFVTSLTTSCAFFANNISNIIAIRCFGIFAGIAVMANFLLMITWTLAEIIIAEKCWAAFQKWAKCNSLSLGWVTTLKSKSKLIFNVLLPTIIKKLWHVLLLIFLGLGIASLFITFHKPALRLPKDKTFNFFPDSHSLSTWNQKFSDKFQFSIAGKQTSKNQITIQFVWGVKPQDTSDPLDPNSKGSLIPNENFEFDDSLTQKWLGEFCAKLLNQSFLSHSVSYVCPAKARELLCSTLLIIVFKECCPSTSQPYNATSNHCLPLITNAARKLLNLTVLGTPIFNAENKVVAYQVFVSTSYIVSASYTEMNKIYKKIEKRAKKMLSTAPPGVQDGWFSGNGAFAFYDLQNAIADGTYKSIALSLAVALIVMLVTSLNILLTIYSIFTITLAICATVASLVLLGWELNILESVTISLAVGLSIDFTIHYGVAYGLSDFVKPKEKVHEAFIKVGSAVFMAALTTFVAGAAVMPANILAYTQLGTFLMLVMVFSWSYATFFFQSLCYILGPIGNTCQIPIPWKKKQNVGDSLTSLDSNMQSDENKGEVESISGKRVKSNGVLGQTDITGIGASFSL